MINPAIIDNKAQEYNITNILIFINKKFQLKKTTK